MINQSSKYRRRCVLSISALFLVVFSSGVGAGDADWELIWEEQFDGYNSWRWEKANHTFKDNAARFVPGNVQFKGGKLRLYLAPKRSGNRNYSGAEYRTREAYLYGKFVVRMRAAPGAGVISSFFTYRNPPRPRWNEIDIEFFGPDRKKIHLNHYWDRWPNNAPKAVRLNFSADEDFHIYSIEWEPGQIKWSIDGKLIYTTRRNIPNLHQKIMMNIWTSNRPSWSGKLDRTALPTYAEYDYVKYYAKKSYSKKE